MDISYNNLPVVLATGDFSVLSKFGNLVIKEGKPASELAQHMVNQNRAIVSEAFSLKHHVNVGDILNLKTPNGPLNLEVTAVYFDYSRERGYIILDRTTFLKNYQESQINSFVIYLNDKTKLNTVRKEILNNLSPTHFKHPFSGKTRKDVLNNMRKFDHSTPRYTPHGTGATNSTTVWLRQS